MILGNNTTDLVDMGWHFFLLPKAEALGVPDIYGKSDSYDLTGSSGSTGPKVENIKRAIRADRHPSRSGEPVGDGGKFVAGEAYHGSFRGLGNTGSMLNSSLARDYAVSTRDTIVRIEVVIQFNLLCLRIHHSSETIKASACV